MALELAVPSAMSPSAVTALSSSSPHDSPREALDSFLKRDDE
jgi:hypothetical protein